MIGWHHRLNGREFEQTPGDSEGQGSLACCSPWGHKKSDKTELLNNNKSSYLLCGSHFQFQNTEVKHQTLTNISNLRHVYKVK